MGTGSGEFSQQAAQVAEIAVTVVEGGAQGVVELAEFTGGRLSERRPPLDHLFFALGQQFFDAFSGGFR